MNELLESKFLNFKELFIKIRSIELKNINEFDYWLKILETIAYELNSLDLIYFDNDQLIDEKEYEIKTKILLKFIFETTNKDLHPIISSSGRSIKNIIKQIRIKLNDNLTNKINCELKDIKYDILNPLDSKFLKLNSKLNLREIYLKIFEFNREYEKFKIQDLKNQTTNCQKQIDDNYKIDCDVLFGVLPNHLKKRALNQIYDHNEKNKLTIDNQEINYFNNSKFDLMNKIESINEIDHFKSSEIKRNIESINHQHKSLNSNGQHKSLNSNDQHKSYDQHKSRKSLGQPKLSNLLDKPKSSNSIDQHKSLNSLNKPKSLNSSDQHKSLNSSDQSKFSNLLDQTKTLDPRNKSESLNSSDKPKLSNLLDQTKLSNLLNHPESLDQPKSSYSPSSINNIRDKVIPQVFRYKFFLPLDQKFYENYTGNKYLLDDN